MTAPVIATVTDYTAMTGIAVYDVATTTRGLVYVNTAFTGSLPIVTDGHDADVTDDLTAEERDAIFGAITDFGRRLDDARRMRGIPALEAQAKTAALTTPRAR